VRERILAGVGEKGGTLLRRGRNQRIVGGAGEGGKKPESYRMTTSGGTAASPTTSDAFPRRWRRRTSNRAEGAGFGNLLDEKDCFGLSPSEARTGWGEDAAPTKRAMHRAAFCEGSWEQTKRNAGGRLGRFGNELVHAGRRRGRASGEKRAASAGFGPTRGRRT